MRTTNSWLRSSTEVNLPRGFDFWLTQKARDKFLITPCSDLGRMCFEGWAIGKHMGTYRLLDTQETIHVSHFLEEYHYKIKHL